MIEISFPVSVSCGFWSGDNDVFVEITEEELVTLQQAVEEAKAEEWDYLDEDGPCSKLFPRIKEAIMDSLSEADIEFDPDEMDFTVGIPELDD